MTTLASTTDLGVRQYAVLKVLRKRPTTGFTDEDLVDLYESLSHARSHLFPRQSPSGIRTRRSELVRGGFVVDSGQRQKLRSGNWAKVWTIA